jgi:tRNA pseudouridine38-40 synthase
MQIRVLGYRRVTKSFEARRLCDRRRYEYILPAFAFDPACCRGEEALPVHVGAAGNIVEKHAGSELDLEAALKVLPAARQPKVQQGGAEDEKGHTLSLSTAAPGAAEPAAAQCNVSLPLNGACQADPQHDSSSSAAGEQQQQNKQHPASAAGGSGQQAATRPPADSSQAGRNRAGAQMLVHHRHVKFTAEQQARLNKILSAYEGTHNFHNYTVRVAPDDPAAMRYILSFKCEGTMEIQVCFFFLSSTILCSSSCQDHSQ